MTITWRRTDGLQQNHSMFVKNIQIELDMDQNVLGCNLDGKGGYNLSRCSSYTSR